MHTEENAARILEEIGSTLRRFDHREMELILDALDSAARVFCAGSGRSGLMMRSFAMRLMHMGFQAYVVGETVTPAIGGNDLLIIGSGSGETGSLRIMAEKAKTVGAYIALFTVMPESSIGGIADHVVHIPATTAKANVPGGTDTVQSRGSLFEQCLFVLLESLVLTIMQKSGFDPDHIMMRHANLE